jgi:hypothetical protein
VEVLNCGLLGWGQYVCLNDGSRLPDYTVVTHKTTVLKRKGTVFANATLMRMLNCRQARYLGLNKINYKVLHNLYLLKGSIQGELNTVNYLRNIHISSMVHDVASCICFTKFNINIHVNFFYRHLQIYCSKGYNFHIIVPKQWWKGRPCAKCTRKMYIWLSRTWFWLCSDVGKHSEMSEWTQQIKVRKICISIKKIVYCQVILL